MKDLECFDMKSVDYYDKNYSPLYFYVQKRTNGGFKIIDVLSGKEEKQHLVKDQDRICRFCGKKEPEVTFHKKAHTFPESIGNKLFISQRNECDSCNELFGRFESDLNVYLLPFLVMNQIKGKNGYKEYKSNNKKSKMRIEEDKIQIDEVFGFSKIEDWEEKKEIKYSFDSNCYIPRNIYRILVKMALAILPNGKVENYKKMLKYVLDSSEPLGLEKAWFSCYMGLDVSDLTVVGYERKSNSLIDPTYQFLFINGNFSFQIGLFDDNDMSKIEGKRITINFVPCPTPFDKMSGGTKTCSLIDLSSNQKTKNGTLIVTFKYDKRK